MPPLFDPAAAWAMLPELLWAARLTLLATLLGFTLALAIGLVACLGGARVRGAARLIRGTPLLVQLYFVYYMLPATGLRLPALTAGVLVIGLHYGCYLSEVYRAGFAALEPGQRDAAAALGLSRLQGLRLVVLPQIVPPLLPVLGNHLIAMLKETPLLSALGVPELLLRAKMIGAETFRYMEAMSLVGLIFLALSLAGSLAVGWLTRRSALPAVPAPACGARRPGFAGRRAGRGR
jgi:polar amino acid transport system permease protein